MKGHGERLRVLVPAYACDAYDVGSGYCAFHWIKALSKFCDITALVRRRRGRPCGTEGVANVQTIHFDEPGIYAKFTGLDRRLQAGYFQFVFRAYKWAKRKMEAQRWDLVHQITPGALRFPSPMAYLGLPFVLGPAGGLHPYPKELAGALPKPPVEWLRAVDTMRMKVDPFFRGTLRRASRLLVFSRQAVEMISPEFRDKCVITPDGGFEELPKETARGSEGNTVEMLFVGRVEVVKGLKFLLKALKKVGKGRNWRLTIVGDGSDLEYERRLTGELGLTERVRFEGRKPREQVNEYYLRADVFCLPSVREGSGLAVLEAMSYGLPVVVCDYAGPAATATEECGFKVPPAKEDAFVEGLAKAVGALVESKELRLKMGAAARRRVEEEFIWEKRAERMIGIYRQILGEG